MINTFNRLVVIIICLTVLTSVSGIAYAVSPPEDNNPMFMYIKHCEAYEPDYTTIDYTNKNIGTVSADNRNGHSAMIIEYTYETSGTKAASISGHTSVSAEAAIIFDKMEAEVGIEVTDSRSWTAGTSSGVSYTVAPGFFEIIAVYIPAVRTAGRLKYKVIPDGYPNSYFYEYETLFESYAPAETSIHFVITSFEGNSVNQCE